jgi:hypothetical protein
MMGPMVALRHQLSVSREPRMEVRLLQIQCMVAAFVSLIIIPINALEHLPVYQNLAVLVLGLLSLWIYRASLQGRHHMKSFTALLVGVINLSWFADAGSLGSMSMFFFVGIMVIAIFFRGGLRWTFLVAFFANVALLFTLDYLHPGWSIPLAGTKARYLELVTGSAISLVACLLVLLTLISSHDQEQQQLAESNRKLQQSLAEISTLQGLLPICAWCKMVRTDQGLWTQVESYLAERTDLSFSHGLCPDCAKKHFGRNGNTGEAPP